MDKRLYQADYISIPLKKNEEHPLGIAQPNFMVVENIFGREMASLPVLGQVLCAKSAYKLVYREILPASEELGRAEELNNIVYEHTNQFIPIQAQPYFFDYTSMQTNIAAINQLLSLFQFRGILQGFVLEVDPIVLQNIIDTENLQS